MSNAFLLLAAINGLLSVAAGAYGRHGPFDAYAREMFAIASQYQITHALALLAVAWLASVAARDRRLVAIAGAAFIIGIVLFSGSLYWFAIIGAVPFAGSAPAGGMLLMLGWLLLIVFAVRNWRRS
ncbi:DUF423 domain-containing protein [Defluviicoccus vanus]|uniref:DUF423 domain-containing protein n=1 Tax=Defluviicoccus vanus TaxID=111831 RepID=A0A7H1MYH5_9PROT|nr:DUF423 domain-containing protein [Defluviicoccus vanus]QNT68511.1 DUF423 domain-containing protein [Defluviicoccus vanus]